MAKSQILFTQFNYTDESAKNLLLEEKFNYVIYKKSICPISLFPVLRGYA